MNYQFLRPLKKEGLITLKELFIDRNRSERQPVYVCLAGLLDTIDALYTRYNTLLHENGYGPKYDLGDAQGEGIGFVHSKGKPRTEKGDSSVESQDFEKA